ncbi:hypothetical protein VTK26DRAFT_3076 [Humicola hyalothermophila]
MLLQSFNSPSPRIKSSANPQAFLYWECPTQGHRTQWPGLEHVESVVRLQTRRTKPVLFPFPCYLRFPTDKLRSMAGLVSLQLDRGGLTPVLRDLFSPMAWMPRRLVGLLLSDSRSAQLQLVCCQVAILISPAVLYLVFSGLFAGREQRHILSSLLSPSSGFLFFASSPSLFIRPMKLCVVSGTTLNKAVP